VICNVPSGLEAGHYGLWVVKSGKWVKVDTLVKVFAPVVNSITVQGNTIQSAALVTLNGLFFSNTPAVVMHYTNSQLQSVDENCSILGSSSAMDTETADSQVQVQIPDLSSANPTSCVFEVKSPNGSAFVYYSNGLGPSQGKLISATLQNTIKKGDVWGYMVDSVVGDVDYKIGKELYVREICYFHTELGNQNRQYDLQLWNINYWTVDTAGNYAVASGVVIVPQGVTEPPLLSFQHGTMLMKKQAPTLSEGAELGFATTFASTDGFLISMPDHLGLGQSTERTQLDLTHPYCQAEPLAVTAIDMMDAVRSFLSWQFDNKLQLKNKLFLAGFSEGGYATMALHRELDTSANDLPPVTASACMEGPYSLSKVMLDKLMAFQKFPVLYFAPYLLVAMDRTYNLYDDSSEYMAFPYDRTVAPLINGYFSEAAVEAQMPPLVRDVLLPSVASELTGYQGPIYNVLLTNDLVPANIPNGAWKPVAPLRLIHGKRDDCVPYANLTLALKYFKALQAPLVTDGSFDNHVVDRIPGTYHATYCPFAMGMAWKYFHDMEP
jgi:pimeloyl-ACP methyl ester carboxylesterase